MNKTIVKIISFTFFLTSLFLGAQAAELGGVTVKDEITLSNGDMLVLNGMGLREKLWIDVYVGSLYLKSKVNNVADVLSQPGSLRIQMDFVYKEVTSKKLNKAWKEGFEKNQPEEKINSLTERMDQFYSFFEESAVKGDSFIIDYIPGQGATISKNGSLLGTITGDDFKNALVEIWLGNFPADKGLKKGMLGL